MVSIGIHIELQYGFSYPQVRDLARLCEETGFNSLWCSDHLFRDERSEGQDCYDPWQMLMALAVDTKTVRLGTLVTCVPFRHPSILAKLAAGVDVVSDGRLEFGVGAGWKELEFRAYGIPFPSPGERVGRLEEAVQIVKAMWTQSRPSFKGKFYQIQEAFCMPKPVQKPHPRVWIGGSHPRLMRVIARHGDGVNIGFSPSPEKYAEVIEPLRRECDAIKRDFNAVQKSHIMPTIVAESKSRIDQTIAGAARFNNRSVEEEAKGRAERGYVGSPEGLARRLSEYTAIGVSQFMLSFPFGQEAESIRLVGSRVFPQVK